jgi:hypothetical protein
MMSAPTVSALTTLAARGLTHSYIEDDRLFSQTVRSISTRYDTHLVREGVSLRYTAIAALGLAACSVEEQRSALNGSLASELLPRLVVEAVDSEDPGTVALTGWAVAEITGVPEAVLLNRMLQSLRSADLLPTVDTAWMLTAAVAALLCTEVSDSDIALALSVASTARDRLRSAQGAQGIFAHAVPAASLGRWRAHIGCFADQIYPIQALSRWAAFSGDVESLAAANLTAARICGMQGEAGEWWWHYDARTGDVIERFPVYSVHQHAMAPMALFDLAAAGGADHQDAIKLGLRWLDSHPESEAGLVSERFALIWRKVGRHEPRKAARSIAAVTTSLHAGWTLTAVDTLFPVGRVDMECRPYELGWLLYAWLVSAPARDSTLNATASERAALLATEWDER